MLNFCDSSVFCYVKNRRDELIVRYMSVDLTVKYIVDNLIVREIRTSY